jgi:hypothetical protein
MIEEVADKSSSPKAAKTRFPRIMSRVGHLLCHATDGVPVAQIRRRQGYPTALHSWLQTPPVLVRDSVALIRVHIIE